MNTDDLLIIGYGNELRSDDGVGPRIAKTIAKWELPHVRVIACHQLAPELVVPIAAAQHVVFVDAAKNSPDVQVRIIEPESSGQLMTHVVNPQALLQLSKLLYGQSPSAMQLTIPATNFGFGADLSNACRAGMRNALKQIRALVEPAVVATGLQSH